jgi:xanthine/CO dehydrogenase XdhC/CoxF family maturation factor
MSNKLNAVLAALPELRKQAKNCVLATIIETFGSTYQKAGARMLITPMGELIGLLGGGCFETDLVEHAQTVFATGTAKTVFYDMRSPVDEIWGLGLGCNGAVKILLQLLSVEQDFAPLNQLAEALAINLSGVLASVIESEHNQFPLGLSVFVPATGVGNRQLLASAPFPFMAAALQTGLQQKPRLETQQIDERAIQVFYDPIQPSLRLLILGAGADALPLVNIAKCLGWHITVVDFRPSHLKPERFPQVDALLTLRPEMLAAGVELNHFNATVLMTHNIEADQAYLQELANSRIPFIGLLGPASRKDRLLQSLHNQAALSLSPRIYGPVGLDIGAETPEEIALSIMAGIQAELKDRNGHSFNVKSKLALHEYLA